ncbi:Sec-independent protein translocase subunit TatA [Sphaerisporangium fuscum]|uniref:Sec-independent protein translocase subunit TatA n=1 Tax=Sphaerisporangium fuscum TaxID=2835868 RepID=UPI001BDC354F|nr:Sec-independent protein translocase subunit TatA [Sphaerisporangium fuscum]
MGELSVWHWLIVLVVLVLLFGSKRLPDMARSLGQSLRLFKGEMRKMDGEDAARLPSDAASPPPQEPDKPRH